MQYERLVCIADPSPDEANYTVTEVQYHRENFSLSVGAFEIHHQDHTTCLASCIPSGIPVFHSGCTYSAVTATQLSSSGF